jgi:hypothetical protein
MTDGEVGFLIICGVVALLSMMFKRKKTPDTLFIEVVEIFEIRKRPRAPRFLVNLAIVAVIGVFIWAVNR